MFRVIFFLKNKHMRCAEGIALFYNISRYPSFRRIPYIFFKLPTLPYAKNPKTIRFSPSYLTVGTYTAHIVFLRVSFKHMHVSSIQKYQILTRPSNWHFPHCSTVQSLCSKVQVNLFFLFLAPSYGFLVPILPLRPAFCQRILTAVSDNFIVLLIFTIWVISIDSKRLFPLLVSIMNVSSLFSFLVVFYRLQF